MRLDSRRLDSHTFQIQLGHSPTSETWKAYDARLQRPVVIKFLLNTTRGSLTSSLSFKQEAEALARLHHPALASLYEAHLLSPAEEDERSAYIVRDYVEGLSLIDYIRAISHTGKLPAAVDLAHLFATMSLVLDHAHQQGVIHGSLKPSNILLRRNSSAGMEPIITDFGINRLLKAASHAPVRRSLDALLYLSPEQVKGLPECRQSDIYALGILLYEVCTGTPPFQGTRPIALLTQHVNAQPTPPHLINPHLSSALSQVIMRSLAKQPVDRYEDAVSMSIALAEALSVPLSELPGQLSRRGEYVKRKERVAPSASASDYQIVSTTNSSLNGAAVKRNETASPTLPFLKRRVQSQRQQAVLTVFVALVLITLITTAFGVLALFHHTPSPSTHSQPVPSALQASVVGHGFFVSSGQLNENSNTQGINDEFQIDLSGLADPGSQNSYYAWLLPDSVQTEAPPILLGALPLHQGRVHLLYTGGKSHLNLLSVTSRLLITRESSSALPTVPPPDTSLWSYYAEIPQAASPADTLHFSMLGHFRHLLVESPELQARGLHGGLVLWLVQSTQRVLDMSNSAREAWQAKDMKTTRTQLISLLDVLDGKDLVRSELPGVPLLADPHSDQIPLLGLKPKNADPPGYSYGDDVPPGYVYLISLHLSGALLSPEATPDQRVKATQINAALNTVDHWLGQAHDDAKQLVLLTPTQLAQPSSLALLNDLATQTRAAYAGQVNTSTDQSQGGVIWISSNVQHLIDFAVTPYKKAG